MSVSDSSYAVALGVDSDPPTKSQKASSTLGHTPSERRKPLGTFDPIGTASDFILKTRRKNENQNAIVGPRRAVGESGWHPYKG